MLALQADEVVLADQEGPVGDEDKALLLVVPVIDSGERTPLSLSGFDSWLGTLQSLAERRIAEENKSEVLVTQYFLSLCFVSAGLRVRALLHTRGFGSVC